MVFKLRGVGAFDGPVAGVVDARRHLVGEEMGAADEELDGEDADVFEAFEEVGEVGFGERLELGVRGCARDAEDAVAVEVFGERIEGELADAAARGDEGDFGVERDHAFEDAGDVVDGGPGFGGLIGGGEAELAFAVVAEAAGFEDAGEADFADGCVERDEVVDGSEGRDLEAAVDEEMFFEEAVLRGGDGARVGVEREAVEDVCVDVLALDGEEVDGFGELGDGVRVVEVDGEDGCDLFGAVTGAAGAEDVGVDGGRGLGEHEGELARTEDADARMAGVGH